MAEDDMAFFGSEDEKWMMGDFDIDLDVDLGRPINFGADESATNQDDSGFQDTNSSGNVDPRKGTPSVTGPAASASAPRNDTVSVSGHNNSLANTGLGPSTNGSTTSAQRSGGFDLGNSTSMGVNPNGNGSGNKEVSFQPLPNVRSGGNGTSIGNGNNRGQPLNGSNGSGNGNYGSGGKPNASNSTVQPSGSGNTRPSAGGFSFPPGTVRAISFPVISRA